MFQSKKFFVVAAVLLIALLAVGCAAEPETIYVTEVVEKEVVVDGETVVVTEVVEVEVAPEVAAPDTFVVCIGQEPDTLYLYGGDMAAALQVQQAFQDGPIDNRSFGYQPILFESLPSLADGSAVIQTVTASEGDTVILGGSPGTLEVGTEEAPTMVRPAGCRTADCEVVYEGGDVEMDQMAVTFTLLPDLMWDDGTPLKASDSVYAFNLVADADTPESKFTTDRTTSYEALDDVTTVWTGLPGFMDATYFINFWGPMPEHSMGQYTALELLEADEAARTPIGWGPYKMSEWLTGESITMVKNEYYHRAAEGLPYFDTLIYRFVGENSNANIAALLAGECDVVDQTSHLDDESELLLELQNAGQLNATFVTGTVWEHADFGINPVTYDDGYDEGVDRPMFFSDVRTRRAIAMCMDRQAVVDTVMLGQSIVLDTYLPPQHPAFNANVTHYDFDVEAGSSLLEEVGWVDSDDDGIREATGIEGVPDGTLLEFDFWTTNATQRQQATQIMAESMAQCGINAKLEYWVPGEYFADGPDGPLFGRRFDIGQFAWLTGVEPPCDLYLSELIPTPDVGWAGQNDPGWVNADFDAACNAALSALPGEDAYLDNHLLAQEIFAEELPVVPLYLRLKLAATRPDMCGFIMDPTSNSEMWNVEEMGYGVLCE